VVVLQHPRESRVAIGSAAMIRLALERAELVVGVRFEGHPGVRALLAEPRAALLYPGPGATLAPSMAADPPDLLFVVDATWHQAERMLEQNPGVAALPRIAVGGERSGYGELRREPGPEHLPTAEAVACALGALEASPARYEPLRTAFRSMVRMQLSVARSGRRNPRHRPGWSPPASGA